MLVMMMMMMITVIEIKTFYPPKIKCGKEVRLVGLVMNLVLLNGYEAFV